MPTAAWLLALLCFWHVPTALATDFGLIDQHGDFHQLSRYSHRQLVLILPFALDDETSLQAAMQLQGMQDTLLAKDVASLLLNASDPEDDIRSRAESLSLQLPILMDGSQTTARALGVARLGEVIALDPSSQDELFRGGLDDESLLANIDAAIAGRPLAEMPEATGNTLSYHYLEHFAERGISYQDDIVPLLRARCAYCHVEGGLAPWAMNRHIMVLGWSPMMRETILTRRMPPGQIDSNVGQWANTQELSDAEMAMLLAWIEDGAPQGGEEDPLTEPFPELPQWPAGQPELVVDLPEQQIPATGNVDFFVERVELNLQEDSWLSAITYDIGALNSLHSLLIYAVDKDAEILSDEDLLDPANAEYISVYVPGEQVDRFADDTGFLLQKDRDLVFKIRYLSTGRETVDRTRIGLHFRGKPERQLQTLTLHKNELNIPAEQLNHAEDMLSDPLPQGARLESYSPHAHSRGKRMRVWAEYPDGSRELLINVANFNYNWQLDYRSLTDKILPAGSRLHAETIYDNTRSNPFNPDPSRTLGNSVSDQGEMFSHFVRLSYELTDAIQTP